jgi:hypothetical protein
VIRLSAPVAALAAVLILLAAASAGAAETPVTEAPVASPVVPNQFSAADQYVESVPTSSGPRPAKSGHRRRAGGTSLPVPPAVNDLSPTLKEVATSPKLGAPDRALPDAKASEPGVPAAAVSALDDGDGGRLLWLLIAIVVISCAIAGTATYRHRTRRATSV